MANENKGLKAISLEILGIADSERMKFYEIGERLQRIEKNQLYTELEYSSFLEYVENELPFSFKKAQKYIALATTYDEIYPVLSRESIDQIHESHVALLVENDLNLTARDKQDIWESVEDEMTDTGKLKTKFVKKALKSFVENSSEQPLPELELGQFCLVDIKAETMDCPKLSKWQGQIVRIEQIHKALYGESHYVCSSLFGEVIGSDFEKLSQSELKPISGDYPQILKLELTVADLAYLGSLADTPSVAVKILIQQQISLIEDRKRLKAA